MRCEEEQNEKGRARRGEDLRCPGLGPHGFARFKLTPFLAAEFLVGLNILRSASARLVWDRDVSQRGVVQAMIGHAYHPGQCLLHPKTITNEE